MTTHDTLMAKIDHYAYRVSDHMPSYREARAALSTAIAKLVAERDHLRECVNGREANDTATVELLRAERDALAKDAARYRWLRHNFDGSLRVALSNDDDYDDFNDIDAAIDAAMKGTPT